MQCSVGRERIIAAEKATCCFIDGIEPNVMKWRLSRPWACPAQPPSLIEAIWSESLAAADVWTARPRQITRLTDPTQKTHFDSRAQASGRLPSAIIRTMT